MKPMPPKVAGPCALLRPMSKVCAYDIWTGATDAEGPEHDSKNGQFVASGGAKTSEEAMNHHDEMANKHIEESRNPKHAPEKQREHDDAHKIHYASSARVNLNRDIGNQSQEYYEGATRAAAASNKAYGLGGLKPMPAKVANPGKLQHGPNAAKPVDVSKPQGYNATAVNKAIGASRPKIGAKEATSIHRLLKGRH